MGGFSRRGAAAEPPRLGRAALGSYGASNPAGRGKNSASGSVEEEMKRECSMARLLRALSGKTQEQMAQEIDVHPSLIAQFELGHTTPGAEHLEKMARAAQIPVAAGEELLAQYDAFRKAGRWRGEGTEALLTDLNETMADQTTRACRRLLSLPRTVGQPEAEELWARLEKRSEAARLALVEVADEYRSPELQEKVAQLAVQEADRDPEHAAGLERLARRIAELAPKSLESPSGGSSRLPII
jgi:transcriptional regulator with XRE-family HTH domain